jgi:hypothetical protein
MLLDAKFVQDLFFKFAKRCAPPVFHCILSTLSHCFAIEFIYYAFEQQTFKFELFKQQKFDQYTLQVNASHQALVAMNARLRTAVVCLICLIFAICVSCVVCDRWRTRIFRRIRIYFVAVECAVRSHFWPDGDASRRV